VSEKIKNALIKIIENGLQLSADGFEFLKTLEEEKVESLTARVINSIKQDSPETQVLDKKFLEDFFMKLEKREAESRVTGKTVFRPLASEYPSQIQLVEESTKDQEGSIDDFLEYFQNRFKKIEGIFKKRIDMQDVVSIDDALRVSLKSKVKIIGIVTNKRTSGSRLFLEIEDLENSISLMATDPQTISKGLSVLSDQVICVEAVKYSQDLFIANDFFWPDVPSHTPRRAQVPLCSVFLADIHIGSRYFQDKLFERFVKWLRMEFGNSRLRLLASRVKYLIIAGDLVDGIGIYPDQLNELDIKDIRRQYAIAAEYLSEIPDYVNIIIIPGNHDAVRKSLPQPPISKDYAELLYDDRTSLFSNPCRLLLNNIETYVCHGKALDDILFKTPGMDFYSPEKGVELLLRCRHVAPIYGNSTPLAPEKTDRLVIEAVPDIVHMGHIHVYGSKRYKGTTLISSSSWQEQTPFQKRVNLTPTVGLVPILDLQTQNTSVLDFKESELIP
jgi:DNA polymerase II small subunit